MKQNIITATLVAATLAVAATSCGIYKNIRRPTTRPSRPNTYRRAKTT